MDLNKIYKRRLKKHIKFRDALYKILCNNFFQKYIPKESVVLEIGAGYCEFINNIKTKKKIALDLNKYAKDYANQDVEFIVSSSTNMQKIRSDSIDVVFINNFFEHIIKEDIDKTIKEIKRILKKNGKILIMQPNIRYCYKDYWMFFDHITPLDDRSMQEVLEINDFKIIKLITKFLPFTTKNRLPKSLILLKLYLKMPLIWRIFGGQMFIAAKNDK